MNVDNQSDKSLKGLKVLVAEDNKMNVMVLKKILAKWEVECDIAENGIQVLEMLKCKVYDLIFMDLQMPEMDGYEATKNIREQKDSYYQTIPIIALTANAMLDKTNEILNKGMSDYVAKPFNPEELKKLIQKYI
jgi:CheY-like chemotaxis protein